MAKIIYIRDTKEKNILILGVYEDEDKTRYTINRAIYSEIGMPAVGDMLEDGALEEIRAFDERYRAKKKALSLLAIADNNKNNLMLKLRHAGYSREVAEETVREMIALGYINEEDQLERLIIAEVKKYSGPRKILAKLSGKGYSANDISRVMASLQNKGEVDFKALRAEFIDKYSSDETDREEIKRLLYKHGF